VESARSRYGFGDRSDVGDSEAVSVDADSDAVSLDANREAGSGHYFTAEQVLALAWKVAGATMAAMGVPRADLRAYGELVEPTIHEIVSEYGVKIPENYRR
jgi:hypothetical protein